MEKVLLMAVIAMMGAPPPAEQSPNITADPVVVTKEVKKVKSVRVRDIQHIQLAAYQRYNRY